MSMYGIEHDLNEVEERVVIRLVSHLETLSLRQSVLRPHLPLKECEHEGDSSVQTRHFGAYQNEELVGVASVFKASIPNECKPDSWRLRGMAVSEKVRKGGCGGKLLKTCIDYVNTQSGKVFWCYARTSAIPFYEKYGFKRRGKKFNFPHVGPVILMLKIL